MKNIAEWTKMDAPDGYYHCANNGNALTEKSAVNDYFEYYKGEIPKEEFIALKHDKMRGNWAIFVPMKYKPICDMAEEQLKAMLDMFTTIMSMNKD